MKFLLVTVLVLLGLILLLAIPFRQERVLSFDVPYFTIYQRLNTSSGWNSWLLKPLVAKQANPKKITLSGADLKFDESVNIIGPGSYIWLGQCKTGGNECFIQMLFDPRADKCRVLLATRLNLFTYLLSGFRNEVFEASHVPALKRYMESPLSLYGFKIYKTHVTDTCILVIREKVRAQDAPKLRMVLLDSLKKIQSLYRLRQVRPLLSELDTIDKKWALLMVGTPVDRTVPGLSGAQYMHMPPGNIIVGQYQGPYHRITALYTAMKRYLADNNLKPVVLPFERFMQNSFPSDTIINTRIQLNMPVY